MLCIYKTIVLLIFARNSIHCQVPTWYGYCTQKRVVKTRNGTAIVENSFCCRNFEKRNNECKECQTGYTSNKGTPCQPCALGTYGYKCAFICKCQDNQRCHNENGCIAIYKAEVTTSTPGNKINDSGLNVREMIVYSVGAGVFVIVMLLCIVYQRRNKSCKTERKKGRNKPDTPTPDVPPGDIEGIYELVDEANMIDNFLNVELSSSTVLGTRQDNCQSNSNVYLTPYEPDGEGSGSNSNNFNGNQFESSSTTNTCHQTTNDPHSTPSNSDTLGRRSARSYLHQPIIHPVVIDIPDYSFTSDSSDSGSSGVETHMTEESSYLNPYQPIIFPVKDSHEYKSLHGCLNG